MEQKLVTLIGTKPFDPQTVLCPICGNVMAPKNAYDDAGDDALEFDYICPDCQSELTVYAADADKQPEPKAIIGDEIVTLARGYQVWNADGSVTDVSNDPRYKCRYRPTNGN